MELTPGSVVLPSSLVLVWALLLALGRPPGLRFFFGSLAVALIALVGAGYLIARSSHTYGCEPMEFCLPVGGMRVLDNALLAFPTIMILLVASVAGAIVRQMGTRRRHSRAEARGTSAPEHD